jgi:hypothetical protein
MPMKLATTLRHIQPLTKTVNKTVLVGFHEYLREVDASENYQNQMLKELVSYVELLGEEQAGELIDELLSLTIPERTFYSEKPDGKLLGLAVDNVEECFFDQNHIGYTLIHDKKINSYQIIKLKSEEFKLNLSKWFVENNNGYELARNEHKIQTFDTLTFED